MKRFQLTWIATSPQGLLAMTVYTSVVMYDDESGSYYERLNALAIAMMVY